MKGVQGEGREIILLGRGVFVLTYRQREPFLVLEKNELGRYECFPRGPGSGVVDRDDVCLRSSNHHVVDHDHHIMMDDFLHFIWL